MPDDLTALLRRALDAEGKDFSWDFYYEADRQALAARLAEVVRPMFENLTVEAVLLAKRERDAARLELAELEAEVRELVKHPERLRPDQKAIARALARREEASRG